MSFIDSMITRETSSPVVIQDSTWKPVSLSPPSSIIITRGTGILGKYGTGFECFRVWMVLRVRTDH